METERLVAGVMTGTSIDGIDLALVQISGTGPGMAARLVRHAARGLGDLRERLRAAAAQTPMPAGAFATLAWSFGEIHATAIEDLLEPGERLDLVAAHGQTVYHAPPSSWQLLEPAPIARRLGCPVVTDLRQADLAAGGRGAPITPWADWILYRHGRHRRTIVNLGGFCNVTLLPAANTPDAHAGIRGHDVCACNHLLDAIARAVLNAPCDDGGRAAGRGRVDPALRVDLGRRLETQRAAARSLGTGDELFDWVVEHRDHAAPGDLAASAVAAVGGCIADALRGGTPDEIVLAGGGTRNRALVDAITAAAPSGVVATSDDLGLPAAAREAVAMAVLGTCCADGVPITLPSVTGVPAPAPVAGRWTTPGTRPPGVTGA